MSAFAVRFPGSECTRCGEEIAVGARAEFDDTRIGPVLARGIRHVVCPDDMPTPRAVAICPDCHLVQPCDCT